MGLRLDQLEKGRIDALSGICAATESGRQIGSHSWRKVAAASLDHPLDERAAELVGSPRLHTLRILDTTHIFRVQAS
jgi:hypothetical protein